MGKWLRKIFIWILKIPVYFYRYFISPMTPASCRHIPTCSEYAIKALEIHGPIKGLYLGTRRILHCHPWGTHGLDPVPPRKIKVKPLKLK
jgi:putative membrane protein insertion efficiency factor